MFLFESALIIVWQLYSPPHWERACVSKKEGNCISSKGGCTSEHAWSFMTPIIVLHFLLQIYACKLCYLAHKISTAYKETTWIIATIFSNIQLFTLSVPLLVIARDDPLDLFLVKTTYIFLNANGVILLSIVPKFYFYYFATELEKKRANPYLISADPSEQNFVNSHQHSSDTVSSEMEDSTFTPPPTMPLNQAWSPDPS